MKLLLTAFTTTALFLSVFDERINASLIGDDVFADLQNPDGSFTTKRFTHNLILGPNQSSVGVGLELRSTLDTIEDRVVVSLINDSAFPITLSSHFIESNALVVWSDLDWVGTPGGALSSLTLLTTTNPFGIDGTFNDHAMYFGLSETGRLIEANTTYTWQFSFSATNAVPESADYVLLSAGLGLMGSLVWRRRRV